MENCTSSPKSYKNYSDFGRICKTVAEIKQSAEFDIYSITDVHTLEKLIGELENNTDFQSYNKKGGNQYSNALSFYLRFLKARELFKSPQNTQKRKVCPNHSLQQIYYGAPGTGKSHTIKEQTEGKDVIRTTFHPDTDYSTFVGAYKPTTKSFPVTTVIGTKAVAVEDEEGHKMTEDKIVYEFVPQAFLQAYVAAWQKFDKVEDLNKPEEEYLVIEEINRGNCAQIFGDLFQLLDRGNAGFSEYPIKADADMKKYLQKALKDVDLEHIANSINTMFNGEDIAEQVKNGDILLLPCNLYIWATMNTSDQSLFPIDSAFKRRWDWQYVPISDAGKNWVVRVNGSDYSWCNFLEEINQRIYKATYSEDKKLGYFFCKADNDGVIDADKFVSKVVFYLWNDVFKDMEFEGDAFKDGENGKLSFDKFYKVEAGKTKVVSDKVELFLKNLGLEPIGYTEVEGSDNSEIEPSKSGHNYLKAVVFDDETFSADNMSKFEVYINALRKIGIDKVVPIIEQSKYKRLGCPLVSVQKYDAIVNSSNYSYVEIDGYQFVKGAADETCINVLNEIKAKLNLSYTLQIHN